ncbi:hypothetical protein [Acinetobacter gerneri]|jgi:hypothetical protein|uniref:hypothetical protein n=1 Tax=Acinetobacter gerneri TaxID=202952 RepID=UPI0023F004B1|nr:hypothetical protein [Acinetobacter gerneri]MCH4243871.1 hypothetical protein [Acinetobacter gerneri]
MKNKFLCLLFCIATHATASPAKDETIQKLFELTDTKNSIQKSYAIKNAKYDLLAQKQVMMHLKNFDQSSLTNKQLLVAAQIAKLMKDQDETFRTPEQEYTYRFNQYKKYHSEESLQYLIQHSQTDAEKVLIQKTDLVGLYYLSTGSETIPSYLSQTDFYPVLIRDILKIKPQDSGMENTP